MIILEIIGTAAIIELIITITAFVIVEKNQLEIEGSPFCIRFVLEWSWVTKARNCGLYKWSKMTNKTGAKSPRSPINAINSSKNPAYSTPVYSIKETRQPRTFQKIRLAYRLAWCDNEDG